MNARNDYDRIAEAITFLFEHQEKHPTLKQLATFLGLSEFHCQRVFKKWVGISPKDFLQFVSLAKAKKLLQRQHSILDTSLEIGLSGPSRLHDLFVKHEAMTPGEYKKAADDMEIKWGQFESPLGTMSIARTHRGICSLTFGHNERITSTQLKSSWPQAMIIKDPAALRGEARKILQHICKGMKRDINLLLKGSPFQIKVWEALLRIPAGTVLSYQQLATNCGKPKAVRAVASAVAANPIAYLVPCHRVIRSTGIIGDYRWGQSRKKTLLAIEAAKYS